MQSWVSKQCIVEGCGAETKGRTYCHKHMLEVKMGKRAKAPVTKEQQAAMRSHCCDAVCKPGARHEYGEQYCKDCGEACRWKNAVA